MPAEGQPPLTLLVRQALSPPPSQRAESPCSSPTAVQPSTGGPLWRVFDLDAGSYTLRFSADGSGVVYISDLNDGEIMIQPLTGGPPRAVLAPDYESVFAFALSRDARQVAYTAGHLTADMILFRNLR